MTDTALIQKLGIDPLYKTCFLNAPASYLAAVGLDPFFKTNQILRPKTHFIHYFARSRTELELAFPKLKGALTKNGLLWISWPKKSSGIESDLSDSAVQKIGLKNGLVDVKTSSIDNVWSGMRFVYRLKDRELD